MSRVDRALGLARSLAIYHAIPLRQRRLRRLYGHFVGAGDLVFDIGAHAGNRVRAFAALGCRVVALEPQPDFAWLLRALFGRSPQIVVVEAAVAARPGRGSLSLSERTPTVTTLSQDFVDSVQHEPGFTKVKWSRGVRVEVVTLQSLVERYGEPKFVKVDVEGFEAEVLAGLTTPVRALSFEYVPATRDIALDCIEQLGVLAEYRYNWSIGETHRLCSEHWLDAVGMRTFLIGLAKGAPSGDVYASRIDVSLPSGSE